MKKKVRLITAASFGAIVLLFSGCSDPVIPQGYALIYGVADYGGANNLNYTDDDAESMAELLETKGWDVRLRIDSDATLSRLETDVDELSAVMTDADRLLFYYSGHGVQIDLENTEPTAADGSEDEVLLLYGSIDTAILYIQGDQSADVLGVTVSDDSLAELLAGVPAVSRMIILDSCFSGGFIGDGYTVDTTEADYTQGENSTVFYPTEALKLYLNYSPTTNDLPQSSYAIMTAAGEDEESFESPSIAHGYFTYYLMQSPGCADYNFDGYISFTEAYKYTALAIDSNFNSGSTSYDYMPHIAAFPVDPVLFAAD